MPLDLPRPKTPPPVAIYTPPYPINLPDATQTIENSDEDGQPTRWWHEWLCGCGEGPDRGGDYQVSKIVYLQTNVILNHCFYRLAEPIPLNKLFAS
jgi:hypothetical protein